MTIKFVVVKVDAAQAKELLAQDGANQWEFLQRLVKSWKTSLIGLTGLAYAAYNATMAATWGAAFHDPAFCLSILMGLQGLTSKDFDKTGGKVTQPKETK